MQIVSRNNVKSRSLSQKFSIKLEIILLFFHLQFPDLRATFACETSEC